MQQNFHECPAQDVEGLGLAQPVFDDIEDAQDSGSLNGCLSARSCRRQLGSWRPDYEAT